MRLYSLSTITMTVSKQKFIFLCTLTHNRNTNTYMHSFYCIIFKQNLDYKFIISSKVNVNERIYEIQLDDEISARENRCENRMHLIGATSCSTYKMRTMERKRKRNKIHISHFHFSLCFFPFSAQRCI